MSIYIAADGDDVGRKLEYLIVTNQIELLQEFFKTFQVAMELFAAQLSDKFDAKIIFHGGDSLLASINSREHRVLEQIEQFRNNFFELSGITLSLGLGDNPRQAYFALKLAKASGKNKTEIFKEYSNDKAITPLYSE